MFSLTHSRLICSVKRISLLLVWIVLTAMAVVPFCYGRTPNKKPAFRRVFSVGYVGRVIETSSRNATDVRCSDHHRPAVVPMMPGAKRGKAATEHWADHPAVAAVAFAAWRSNASQPRPAFARHRAMPVVASRARHSDLVRSPVAPVRL